MAALAAGDLVVPIASIVGGFAAVHTTRPLFGIVESLVAGAPPTNVVVDWADGTQTTYAAVNSGGTSVIGKVGGFGPVFLVGFVAQPTSTSGIPNPGGRLQGPVVDQYILSDANDTPIVEVVVIDTPIGFLVTAIANVQQVPSA